MTVETVPVQKSGVVGRAGVCRGFSAVTIDTLAWSAVVDAAPMASVAIESAMDTSQREVAHRVLEI